MQFTRKLGIAIVMIVPAFVFGGAIWALFGSWLGVLGLEILIVLIYYAIISGRLSAVVQETQTTQ